MHPSFFSKFLMTLILPAQNYPKNPQEQASPKHNGYNVLKRSHHGLDTLEATLIDQSLNSKYVVHFCGNGDDGLNPGIVRKKLNDDGSSNHIFWNYPNVLSSQGEVKSPQDLIQAGYLQVMRLIDQGVLGENICLNGFSLGGGIAVAVARRLHEEGHYVNLDIDRSFSSISLTVFTLYDNFMKPQANRAKNLFYMGLGFSFVGITLGALLSSIIATFGYLFSMIFGKPLEDLINLIGACIGGIVASVSCIVLGLLGGLIGYGLYCLNMDFQLPLLPFIKAFLMVTACEIDSVYEMNRLLAADKKANRYCDIQVKNVWDDEIILKEASLSRGLKDTVEKPSKLINFTWYKTGGHNGLINKDNIFSPVF